MRVVALASGSTGNSTLLQWEGGSLLIDAGISARRVRTMLRNEGTELSDLAAILITHDHSDHISGLQVLLRQCACPVFAMPGTAKTLRMLLREHESRFHDASSEGLCLADAAVMPIPTMHDASESCGWRVRTPDGVFGLCTDLGVVTEDVVEGLCGADLALIESNHDVNMLLRGPYPPYLKRRIRSEFGHLSNEDAADLAVTLCANGTRSLILGHISRHNNTPATALGTVSAALREALPDALQPELVAAPECGPLSVEVKVSAPCSL